MKKIGKILLNFNSAVAFYIPSFLLMILAFMRVDKGVIVGSIIACLFCVIRLIYRTMFVKRGQTIVLHSLDYTRDQELQGDNLGDVAALILYLLLCILEMPWTNMDAKEWTGVFMLYSMLYFAVADFSVKKNDVLSKVATVTISTAHGFFLVMFLLAYACLCLLSVIEEGRLERVTFGDGYLLDLLIITGTYALEKYPLATVIPVVVSALLYVIYTLNTPIYQLAKIKIAYNVVNIFATLLGVFAFFFSKNYGEFIVDNITEIMNSPDGMDIMMTMPNATEYFARFGVSNINNLFYLLVLPYAFGILVANMCIENKERKADKKRKEILKKFYLQETYDEEKIIEMKKEYLYWGGDLIECDAYIQLGKMNNQHEELVEY